MADGRKYGRLAYGRYTYDLWPSWKPISPEPPVDVWVPIPGLPPDGWGPTYPPFSCSAPDVWVGVGMAATNWGSALSAPTEIWVPVTKPVLNG